MTVNPTYRKAFYYAISLHLLMIALLFTDTSPKKSALSLEAKNTPGIAQPQPAPQHEVVKAVSVDSSEVMKTVTRLQKEREQQKRAEVSRQNQLRQQAEVAKQQRIKEQQKLAHLKEEANQIAIARKKQAEEEQKHLKQLAEQKAKESKKLEDLKKQQEQLLKKQETESKKMAELNKKQAETKANQVKAMQEALEKQKAAEQAKHAQAQADSERKKQAEAAAAALEAQRQAANQARVAGEVDKYKTLIVNAIGQHWILPENADSSLSSQFRIRLAPDGMVLEVSLTRSSGDPLLDRSAQNAIRKASPLPVPSDSETFNLFRDISLTVRPEHIRG